MPYRLPSGKGGEDRTYEDLQGNDETSLVRSPLPSKYILIDHLDPVPHTSLVRPGALTPRERRRNLDDTILRLGVDLGVGIAYVSQCIEHEGAIPGADFVDDEILVGVMVSFVRSEYCRGECAGVVGLQRGER